MAVIRDVMPAFELFQPTSVDDTLGLLAQHGANAWILAGGLDTFDWLKDRSKRTDVVIDLSQVSELRGIKELDGGLEIGALTTLTEVVTHPVVRAKFGLLMEAAELVASPQIRNQGTLGGNVSQDTRCWYYRSGWTCYRAGGNICYADTPTAINREHAILQADRCVAVSPSDTAPALIALDAQLVLRSRSGERLVARPLVKPPAQLRALADAAQRMLRDALDAFAQSDTERARQVLLADDRVDLDQDRVVEMLIRDIGEHPELSPQEVDLILIAENLERVGDHATNIAEDVILAAEARNLKHADKLARSAAR